MVLGGKIVAAVKAEEPDDEEEEGLVDPQEVLRTQCAEEKKCASLKERLDACNARVGSRTKSSETCVEEVIDFMHCVDHCASKTLFSKLK
ncbi:hypothetical protein BsWGS_19464 [Bradybaena similaris]